MKLNNTLLVAGTCQNVGKTTFIRDILDKYKGKDITVIKTSNHFHKVDEENIIEKSDAYIIYKEKNLDTNKDSSLYLQHGAKESYFIMAEKDEEAKRAFDIIYSKLNPQNPLICESTALIKHIQPALFVSLSKKGEEIIPSKAELLNLADQKFDDYFSYRDEIIEKVNIINDKWHFA
jgi:hypothetical protein